LVINAVEAVPELDAKRLEVLKEILPSSRRLGLLIETGTRSPAVLQPMLATARALGVALQKVEVSAPADFAAAVASLKAGGVEGPNILSSTVLFFFHKDLGPLLVANKVAAICEWPEMTASGCLASYGTTLRELYAMQAALIDKMLKGARPADTPAQQPVRAGPQPQGGARDRRRDPSRNPRPRRRGHRMSHAPECARP